mgnify:CR=1 FL=1
MQGPGWFGRLAEGEGRVMKSLEESLARLLLSAVSLTGCVWEHPSPTGEVGEVHQALAQQQR